MSLSKPKWKTEYDAHRKYNTTWENEYPWVKKALSKGRNGSDQAFCSLCRSTMQCHRSTLKAHSPNKHHVACVESQSHTKKNFFAPKPVPKQDDQTKIAELEIATAVACHCSIMTIYHLGETVKRHGVGSTVGKMSIHRTKCAQLIKRILAPEIEEELKRDIKECKYSLMIDEATDIATDKNLCVCVRYFSVKNEMMMTVFLGLVQVIETTGAALFETLESLISMFNMRWEDCIGYGCDGASNMVG